MSQRVSHIAHNMRRFWFGLSLSGQFVVAGSLILLAGMFLMGLWVTSKIEKSVTQNSASATALYMDSFITPLVQELVERDVLSEKAMKSLQHLFANKLAERGILSLKIWKDGGRVVFSNHKSIIGRVFPLTPELTGAWAGNIKAVFDNLDDEEDRLERATGIALLEMYSPIRDASSGRIIAVAEFYEDASKLKNELLRAKLESWFFVAALTIIMFGLLSGIIRRGSRTIETQRKWLEKRIVRLSRLLAQNERLRARARQSSMRSTEINEHFLRRISADLHDGPAQLLGLVLLRLDDLNPSPADVEEHSSAGKRDFEAIRRALDDALGEIRNISAGLALPELENLTLQETMKKAVHRHEHHTGTHVKTSYSNLPEKTTMPFKISAYRFIQEALTNAFQHADAKDQRVEAGYDGSSLQIIVSDNGHGFDPLNMTTKDELGLPGLRERIESLGGIFEIDSAINAGTRLIARIPLEATGIEND